MAPAQINLMNIESYNLSYFKAIALSGIVDDSQLPQLRQLCLNMLRAEEKSFIMDMSRVIKVSRKVLELFSDVAKKLNLLNGKLLIMNMNPQIFQKIKTGMNIDPNLGYFANEMEASRYIESSREYYCF